MPYFIRFLWCAAVCLAVSSMPVPTSAALAEWEPLLDRLEDDGLDRAELERLFSLPGAVFDHGAMVHKMEALYRTKYGSAGVLLMQQLLVSLGFDCGKPDGMAGSDTRWAVRAFQLVAGYPVDGVIDESLMARLAVSNVQAPPGFTEPREETAAGPPVYHSMLTRERLAESLAFYRENRARLELLESTYGVPADIAVGLLSVETRVGNYLGEDDVFTTLASMAMCGDYSLLVAGLKADGFFERENPSADRLEWLANRTREKAEWAYEELKALIVHATENGHDITAIKGSIYGAIGLCQFMPSNAVIFGRDGNGDGRVDLFQPDDALMSLGNYLVEHGWEAGIDESRQRKVLYRYNHSKIYVNTIMAVAAYLRSNSSP